MKMTKLDAPTVVSWPWVSTHGPRGIPPENLTWRLVVACHACQHLAREIIDHCMAHNTPFAVCPCCPKDHQGQRAGGGAGSGRTANAGGHQLAWCVYMAGILVPSKIEVWHEMVYMIPSTSFNYPQPSTSFGRWVRPWARTSPGRRQVVGGGIPCSHDPGGGVALGDGGTPKFQGWGYSQIIPD